MNSTAQTSFTLDYWLGLVGSSKILDSLYLYVLTPISALAIILNSIALHIQHKKPFRNSTFNEYLKIYTFNSLLLSLLQTTAFTNKTYRLFSFTNTYEAMFYGCYFYTPLVSILYINISLLEICIIVRRILYFNKYPFIFRKYFKTKIVCSILLLISILVNFLIYFMFKPYYVQVIIEDNSLFGINFIIQTEFFLTLSGTMLIHVMFEIRDILILLVKLVLNIILVVLIRRYIIKIKTEKKEFSMRISTNMLHTEVPISDKAPNYLNSTERNQTYLAIIMCVFSAIKHLFYIASYIIKFINNDNFAFYIYYLFLLSISIESLTNFLLLYKYNNLFKCEFRKSFSLFKRYYIQKLNNFKILQS